MNHTGSYDRRRWLQAASTLPLLGLLQPAQTQTLAPGLAKMMVPFTPGTTPDAIARVLAPLLSRSLERDFVVENRPGASGILGMDAVAKAEPNGLTTMITTNTTLTLPYFYKQVPFHVLDSFEPIALIGDINFALVVHASVPARTVKEWVAYVKAQPGKVDYASPGRGTLHSLALEKIAMATGVELNHIPYKGTAGAVADVLGGHVPMMILPLNMVVPLQAEGKLRIIGSTRAERDAQHAQVTPLQEGGVPDFDESAWAAVWGPKGMDARVVEAYNRAINAALAQEAIKTSLAGQGVMLTPGSPNALRARALAEYEK